MSYINIQNLTFSYPTNSKVIFENVNLNLESDWKLGLIGRNGRGKSTFLKILHGYYPYIGNITKSVNFEYFPYIIKDTSLNIIDIILNEIPHIEEWKIYKELSLLDFNESSFYTPYKDLSLGEKTKGQLVLLFLLDNSFILIDEPTNHLDIKGREILGNYLNKKKNFILVSHDRDLLDACVDHILSINKNNIEIQKGNFTTYITNFNNQQNFEYNTNEKLKKEIKHLKEAQERTAHWSDLIEATKIGNHVFDKGYVGHSAAIMMQKSKAIEKRRERQIVEKEKLLKNFETVEDLKLPILNYKKETLLQIAHLNIKYDNNIVLNDFSMEINNGDRIALIGKNGSGKTSIIKAILNQIEYEGIIKRHQIIISYLVQDNPPPKTNVKQFIKDEVENENIFSSVLIKLGFTYDDFDKEISSFSDGQQKEIYFAKSLAKKAHLYIWDEPLNYLDIYAREKIEKIILQNNISILFIEHDKYFCDKVSTKQIIL